MYISTFLDTLHRHNLSDNHIWCFISAPSHVVVQTIQYHSAAFNASGVQRIDVHEADIAHIRAQLTTAFLGQKYVYILQGMYSLDKRVQKRICDMIFSQTLCHHVVLFTEHESLIQQYIKQYQTGVYIRCDRISRDPFVRIYYILFHQTFPQAYCAYIFSQFTSLTFDTAYLVMTYYYFLGKRFPEWCHEWLSYVVTQRISLFQLSEYFFKKNATKVWLTWDEMQPMYPHEFWVAFWSEQLWQAYTFITIARNHTVARARTYVNKLPYSFMQGDWRHISLHTIVRAMVYIYEMDVALKSGGVHHTCDAFIALWLADSFPHEAIWCYNTSRNNNRHSLVSR